MPAGECAFAKIVFKRKGSVKNTGMGNTGSSEDCAKLAGSLCGGSVSLQDI